MLLLLLVRYVVWWNNGRVKKETAFASVLVRELRAFERLPHFRTRMRLWTRLQASMLMRESKAAGNSASGTRECRCRTMLQMVGRLDGRMRVGRRPRARFNCFSKGGIDAPLEWRPSQQAASGKGPFGAAGDAKPVQGLHCAWPRRVHASKYRGGRNSAQSPGAVPE